MIELNKNPKLVLFLLSTPEHLKGGLNSSMFNLFYSMTIIYSKRKLKFMDNIIYLW